MGWRLWVLGVPALLFAFVLRCGDLKFFGTPRVASEDKCKFFFCDCWLFQTQPLHFGCSLCVSLTHCFMSCEKAKNLDLRDVCLFLSHLIIWSIVDTVSRTLEVGSQRFHYLHCKGAQRSPAIKRSSDHSW